MSNMYGGSSDQVQGPGSAYTVAGNQGLADETPNIGFTDETPSNIAEPLEGMIEVGPPDVETGNMIDGGEKNKDPDTNPTWEQRAFILLSFLKESTSFGQLGLELRNQINNLISDAPPKAHP
jgi:hypothetical protein